MMELDGASCDVCGSERVTWRKCKLVCLSCGTILKSCADLWTLSGMPRISRLR